MRRNRCARWCWATVPAALALPCPAQPPGVLQNWFDDPFFQITADVHGCPLPAGPFVTEAERRAQSHRRAEKGTTCWLAGECERPQAYAYDHDIARNLQAALARQPRFAGTTLWVTVQGRVVYIEGCAGETSVAADVEAFVRRLPHVQQAIAILRIGAAPRTPYAVRPLTPPNPPPPR